MEKILTQNINRNSAPDPRLEMGLSTKKKHSKTLDSGRSANLSFLTLDWEVDSALSLPALLVESKHMGDGTIDVVLACDCIYNESLVAPFVRTCFELCRVDEAKPSKQPTICIIAQQLRSPDVFEAWLTFFIESFRVWRVPEALLSDDLKQNSGFVVHIGIINTRCIE